MLHPLWPVGVLFILILTLSPMQNIIKSLISSGRGLYKYTAALIRGGWTSGWAAALRESSRVQWGGSMLKLNSGSFQIGDWLKFLTTQYFQKIWLESHERQPGWVKRGNWRGVHRGMWKIPTKCGKDGWWVGCLTADLEALWAKWMKNWLGDMRPIWCRY